MEKPTLKYGCVLDDEMFELSADNLQARLHVAARSYLIPLLHLLRTAGRAFGLADLQICTCQEIKNDKTEVLICSSFHPHHLQANHRKHHPKRIHSLNERLIII